jgi:hypothetical protein
VECLFVSGEGGDLSSLFPFFFASSLLHHYLSSQLMTAISRATDKNEFCYIPEFYFESCIDLFHGLRRSEPPFPLLSHEQRPHLLEFLQFVMSHFNDKRIVNPEMRDILLQSLSVLLQYDEFLEVFSSEGETLNRQKENEPALLFSFVYPLYLSISLSLS